jgi:hypothetical protein
VERSWRGHLLPVAAAAAAGVDVAGVVAVENGVLVSVAFHQNCVRAHACVALLNACFQSGNHSFAQLLIRRTLQSHTIQNL